MTPEQLEQVIKKKLEQIKQLKKEDVPHIIGKEALLIKRSKGGKM